MREKTFKEHAKHGQISLYKHDGKGSMFNYHWHDEYEFLYFYKNSAILKIENHSFEMPAGTCAIINPGELHSVTSKKTTDCGLYALVFNMPDVFESFQNILSDNEVAIKIFSTYLTENHSHLDLKSQIYHLLHALEKENKIKPPLNSPTHNENIKTVLSFIENNYHTKITIDDLAEQANISKYHFIRVFKSYTDMSPIKYLVSIRISKAKDILKAGNADITNTALQVGFDNISYFIKVFKETCGVTPLKYLKENSPLK